MVSLVRCAAAGSADPKATARASASPATNRFMVPSNSTGRPKRPALWLPWPDEPAMTAVVILSRRPGQRIGLHVGEALHRLDDALLVAEAGVLDAAERRHLDAVARHFPDVDRTHFQLVDEAGDVVEPAGAHAGRQPVGGRIGHADDGGYVVGAADQR